MNMHKKIVEIASFPFAASLKARWKNGELHREWARRYPELFDADDLRLAQNQSEFGYHFVEWLSAILLYNATGGRR